MPMRLLPQTPPQREDVVWDTAWQHLDFQKWYGFPRWSALADLFDYKVYLEADLEAVQPCLKNSLNCLQVDWSSNFLHWTPLFSNWNLTATESCHQKLCVFEASRNVSREWRNGTKQFQAWPSIWSLSHHWVSSHQSPGYTAEEIERRCDVVDRANAKAGSKNQWKNVERTGVGDKRWNFYSISMLTCQQKSPSPATADLLKIHLRWSNPLLSVLIWWCEAVMWADPKVEGAVVGWFEQRWGDFLWHFVRGFFGGCLVGWLTWL